LLATPGCAIEENLVSIGEKPGRCKQRPYKITLTKVIPAKKLLKGFD
jgi:hypothetical protein